jgi:hypothetical protein
MDLLGGRGAVPRKHPFGRDERYQPGHPVFLRGRGGGDAGYAATTRQLRRFTAGRHFERIGSQRILPRGFAALLPAVKPPSGPDWVMRSSTKAIGRSRTATAGLCAPGHRRGATLSVEHPDEDGGNFGVSAGLSVKRLASIAFSTPGRRNDHPKEATLRSGAETLGSHALHWMPQPASI